ncbi:hypothetical protein OB2597_04273 [Pseudooceanicola batsensis HTCC2597]|uniref:DNA-binding protein HU n=1 Tax=Pseudooceanicola batsensis (strain ATCC BAA-863 / DSM 15984 / KCTC 12145 / HTCC2597) TaxID=252305 RepID=A3U2Q1_PSEBH|nr:HU family DNA-binding protein [Pseudooceanicola batsensis]EAQ01625.1 hypothetical protein OB2597_04273 [Pseudooceanicola batsensis HTCC2597]
MASRKSDSPEASSAADLAAPPLNPAGRPEPEVPDDFRMKDLLAAVTDAGGLKRSKVRAVTEEVLRQLGVALGQGRAVSLPGLGKIKTKRAKTVGGRRVLELRVRQDAGTAEPAKGRADGVAEGGD